MELNQTPGSGHPQSLHVNVVAPSPSSGYNLVNILLWGTALKRHDFDPDIS